MSNKHRRFPRQVECDCTRTYTARTHYDLVYGCPTCRAMTIRAMAGLVDEPKRAPTPEHVYRVAV